jgi:hypothetical protein
MTGVAQLIRRASWLACVCLAVAAPRASAGPSVVADFDGDGQRDRVTLELPQSSVLRVWLSTTQTIAVLHSSSPILEVAARDLDGDRRDELIAGGSSGLQVWTARHKRFKPFHPREVPSRALTSSTGHRVDEGSGDALDADMPAGASALGLTLTPEPRGPTFHSTRVPRLSPDPAVSALTLEPFAPRPPPLSL